MGMMDDLGPADGHGPTARARRRPAPIILVFAGISLVVSLLGVYLISGSGPAPSKGIGIVRRGNGVWVVACESSGIARFEISRSRSGSSGGFERVQLVEVADAGRATARVEVYPEVSDGYLLEGDDLDTGADLVVSELQAVDGGTRSVYVIPFRIDAMSPDRVYLSGGSVSTRDFSRDHSGCLPGHAAETDPEPG